MKKIIQFVALLFILICTISAKEKTNQDCTRGVAQPIISKKVYPNTTFKLNKDKLTSVETVIFKNGDKLIIKNEGCEYYVLKFRFETSRFQESTSDLAFWFKKSALLTSELYNGIIEANFIKRGIDKLILKTESNQNLKLGEEIDFGSDEMREFFNNRQNRKIIK
jgi:hypothetical protein